MESHLHAWSLNERRDNVSFSRLPLEGKALLGGFSRLSKKNRKLKDRLLKFSGHEKNKPGVLERGRLDLGSVVFGKK